MFAPTNAAFAKLKKAAPATFNTIATTPSLLKKILMYHVLPSEVDAMAATAAAKQGAAVKTLEGEKIKLSIVAGKLTLNGSSTVIKADIAASNGVVHLINTVLVPPSVVRSTAELRKIPAGRRSRTRLPPAANHD